MSSSLIEAKSLPHNNTSLNYDSDIIEKSSITKIYSKSNNSRKFSNAAKKNHQESVLFTMIKLIIEHRDQITISDSILSINSEDLDLAQKLNYYMEILTHIPFSFQYSNQQTKIILDFFHLEKEIQLLTNMEI